MEMNMYIGFWTLGIMKCTQHGLYGQATFKNARVRPRLGGGGFTPQSGVRFRVGQGGGDEALVFLVLPLPAALTRATLVGGI
jgi:hypothetical protein